MLDICLPKQASLVGRHHKKPSLVGFYPLLTRATGDEEVDLRDDVPVIPASSTIVQTPPVLAPSSVSSSSGQHKRNITPCQLTDELRILASEIGKASPTPSPSPQASPQPQQPSPASRSRTSILGRSSNANSKLNIKLAWNKKKVPTTPSSDNNCNNIKQRERSKTVELPAGNVYEWTSSPSQLMTPVSSRGTQKNSMTPSTTGNSAPSSAFSSPMMQELWYTSSEAAMNDLALPSLSKPRATSFLTGKEPRARTSEQNPTRWQIDIPKKLDLDVSVRTCQFLNTYQDEECCLNLGDLIPFSRLELTEFAKGNASSLDEKVADCHRPVVEALLECGDDIAQVRGHYISPSSSGTTNPKDRREFLVLERQNNQLLVVFRGTRVEQQGKTGTGIINGTAVSLKQGGNTSGGGDGGSAVEVLKLYEEAMVNDGLEHAAFEILDRLTEENPFCDIAFTGFAYGAALASYSAYRYAYMRSHIRVQLLGFSTPKIGFESLRFSAHSLPNLKPIRIEIENNNSITLSSQSYYVNTGSNNSKATGGGPCHFGHIIRINTSLLSREEGSAGANPAIRAFKFGEYCQHNHNHKHKHKHKQPRSLPSLKAASKGHMQPVLQLIKSAKATVAGGGLVEQFVHGIVGAGFNLFDYVAALEGAGGEKEWVQDYYKQDGTGIRVQ